VYAPLRRANDPLSNCLPGFTQGISFFGLNMPFGKPDYFEVEPTQPSLWGSSQPNAEWVNDENKKKEFGIELAKQENPFNAACEIFKDDTGAALWISKHWLIDPVVIAARDLYLEAKAAETNLLDKHQLAARLLKFAEEKDVSQRFYITEAKDRLAALKLYAEICGFIGAGKVEIDASTKNINNNVMKIVLVKPDNQNDTKVIEAVSDIEPVDNPLPINIKLVGGGKG
jgi:hypothetical protein